MLKNAKKTFAFVLCTLVFVSCSQSSDPTSVKVTTEDEKTFYAMGLMLGQNLSRLDLKDQELSALYKGLYTAAKNQKAEIEWMEYQPKIQEMFQGRMKIAAAKQKKEGEDFIAKKVSEGFTKTASGLVYKIETEGTGAQPKSTDQVEVNYKGTLMDGTVFDSSYDRKQSVTFPLDRVIKGWTEGIQLMKEGGKATLVIPSDLGYGDMGAPPKIPGGATLIFEVELIKIKKEDAAKVANAAVEKKDDKKDAGKKAAKKEAAPKEEAKKH